ncbi:MAG: DUF6273 domain-containing protein [Oscillospiraceae bacterium]|nr:DUF6273 domain-containing protein [Oscillospiraceae bacterium]
MIAPKIGSIIKFGKYNWQVLDVQNNAALIITEEIIEKKAYHSNRTAITWADCDLRKYLNGEFINNAKNFSPNDKARIISVMNGNRENQWYDTNGGNETTDSIFLLSLYELVKYFGDSGDLENGKGWKYESGKNVLAYGNDRRYIHDQYDKSRVSKYGNKVSWWWLRSPGYSSDYAAFVYDDGFVRIIGYGVDIDSGGVRPALWLDL